MEVFMIKKLTTILIFFVTIMQNLSCYSHGTYQDKLFNEQREAIEKAYSVIAPKFDNRGDRAHRLLEDLMSCHKKNIRTLTDESKDWWKCDEQKRMEYNKECEERCKNAVILLDEYKNGINEKMNLGEKEKEALLSRLNDIRSYYFDSNLYDQTDKELNEEKERHLTLLAKKAIYWLIPLPETPFFKKYGRTWEALYLNFSAWMRGEVTGDATEISKIRL
jgi:hypothetical protein